LAAAVALVCPGATLALGGAVHAGRPAAFIRALLRAGTDELTLYPSPGSGWDADLMIALKRVRRTVIPMVTLAEHGLAPSFRLAVERGEITAAYFDAMSAVAAYLAAGYGHPFHLVAGLEGTSIAADPELFDQVTDSTGTTHRVVRALVPDVCVLHAEEADEFGNVRHARGRVLDVLAAKAARTTIVTAERIVPNDQVRREPERTTVPGQYVDAVVEAPRGAYPTATAEYGADSDHLRAYARAAEARRRGDGTAFDDYVERFVIQEVAGAAVGR
jgi:glutaconate CoA-transferase subunit A